MLLPFLPPEQWQRNSNALEEINAEIARITALYYYSKLTTDMARLNSKRPPARDNESEMARRRKVPKMPLTVALEKLVFGQTEAIQRIVPYIEIYQSGLSPENRPVGNFLLLGSTGSGKTYLVESLAEVLHGSSKNVLRIDCGEFQTEHEVAKLIGAPPGYLGHRETQPFITSNKLNSVTSEHCGLSIVLFDEIEKAANSVAKILLGVMDKGTLRLGDGNTVYFNKSLIFFTSNLGAAEMARQAKQKWNFAAVQEQVDSDRIKSIAVRTLKKRYSPEFCNRLDETVVFNRLGLEAGRQIAVAELDRLCDFIERKRGLSFAGMSYGDEVVEYLANLCLDVNQGAREAKRAVTKELLRRIAPAFGELGIGERVKVLVKRGLEGLEVKTRKEKEVVAEAA